MSALLSTCAARKGLIADIAGSFWAKDVLASMPAAKKGVDGRDKAGHDGERTL
jgi:hypothetical protein